MNTYPTAQTRTRLAAFGAATTMTLAVLAGIGTLAQVQPAETALQAQATPVQQVVVIGQRPGRI